MTRRPELWIAGIGGNTITSFVCEPVRSMHWVVNCQVLCGIGEEPELIPGNECSGPSNTFTRDRTEAYSVSYHMILH